MGVCERTDLHVDVAFGYVNFVERVGEGGIETIERPALEIREEQNSTKWSSFLAKLLKRAKQTTPHQHSDGSISIKITELRTKCKVDRFRL